MKFFKAITVVLVIVLFVGLGIGFYNGTQKETEGEDEMSNKIITMKKEKKVFDKLSEVEITTNDEKDSVISTKAVFDLKFEKDVPDDYVENTFSLKPSQEVSITKVNSKYYQLTSISELDENQIYNIVEKTTEGTEKWAFQTEKIFRVEYTYPSDKEFLPETGVPEIAFNGKVAENIDLDNFIVIEPEIKGNWKEAYSYNYRFEHDTHFIPETTYTITVKKGLKDTDGNELKEDYATQFIVANEEDISANLEIMTMYKPNTTINLNMDLNLNLNKALSLKNANIKIIKLGSKEEFINAFENIYDSQKVKEYSQQKGIFEKDIQTDIKNAYDTAKSKNRFYYYEEIPIESNLMIAEEGYYLALLTINSHTNASLFQINNATATCSVLSENNFMILYKGNNGNNNSVDVFVNDEKLGRTSEDGLLYVEDFRNSIKNLKDKTNYIEFKNGATSVICDISGQVNKEYQGENFLTSLSRFNNGYVYTDRQYYKTGETIHIWGYAKNRKVDVKSATLKLIANYDDVLAEIPVTLNEVGSFNVDYEIANVNEESNISIILCIGETPVNSCYVEIKNYELKQYNIEIKPEKYSYLDGDTAVINIKAETYDGTPLGDLDFSYAIENEYYNNTIKSQQGTIKTNDYGLATIEVPLIINHEKNNILAESAEVTILNSYIDGEQENIFFNVYPYKNYANGKAKFIVDENKYYLSFDEYLSLDKDIAANDAIKVNAKAYKTVREVTGTRYNKYTKEMEEIVTYKHVEESSYDKTFTINMQNGKGTYELPNYRDDKNCYYEFYAYLVTDTGKELALNYDGHVYYSSYKTITSDSIYEEVQEVAPIINPEITYTIQYETDMNLKVGDEVNLYLQDDEGRRINDYSAFDFYTLVVSAEGNKIYHNKGENPHFTFTKEMGANVATYILLYDSLKTYSPSRSNRLYSSRNLIDFYSYYSYSEIRLCDEELSLDIDISFDKDKYEPKEEAEVAIKVTSNGQGVKAGVNLSAVDTAFIDANGENATNIINSLMNSYVIAASSGAQKSRSVTIKSFGASMNASNDMALEEAAMAPGLGLGGGGDETVRDDLKVTAFFENILTDENGVAKIKIKMPDNITEWTVKAQAISADYKVGVSEKKIKVSKDFFVDVNHKNRYLAGEKFAFDIKSFSKDFKGNDVEFLIELLDEQNNVIEQNTLIAKVSEVLSYQVASPIAKTGIYKIRITGTCSNVKDILVDEVEITDSLLDATIRENMLLRVGDTITIVSPKGYLYILNKDVEKILPTLFELCCLYNENRNDTTLISSEANRILNNLINGAEFDYLKKINMDEENIFKVMRNSSEDARLALRMLATKALNIKSETVADKIEVRLGEEAAMWAKANLDMISLKELDACKEEILANSEKYTKADVLYLALAYADIGSYKDSTELYQIVKDEVTEKDEIEFELKVILTIKLNLKEHEGLYNTYMQKEALPENQDFIKLYFLQNSLSKNFKEGSLTLSINGVNEDVKINNVGLTRKLIARKDAVKVVSMSDNLGCMIEQYKSVDFYKLPNQKYIVSKSYSNNAKLGDIVEVTIAIDNKKLYDDGIKYGYKIEDAIPNNMTFVEYIYGADGAGYLRKQDGQKLTIHCWNPYDPKYNPSKTKSELKYKARITNGGEQYEPGAIMLKYNNEIIDGIKK